MVTKMEKKRQEKGYTQQYVADNIEVSVGCYNMYENNQRKIPKEKAELIAKLLNCKVDDIFEPFTFTNCETKSRELN